MIIHTKDYSMAVAISVMITFLSMLFSPILYLCVLQTKTKSFKIIGLPDNNNNNNDDNNHQNRILEESFGKNTFLHFAGRWILLALE